MSMRKIIIMILIMNTFIFADKKTHIRIGDKKMDKYVGEQFDIAFGIVEANAITGIGFDIVYDPAIIMAVDTDESADGTQLEVVDNGFISDATLLIQVASSGGDELPGTIIAGISPLGDRNPTDGDGELFRVKFETVASGNTTIELANIHLYDVDGNEIDPESFEGGSDIVDALARMQLTVTVL